MDPEERSDGPPLIADEDPVANVGGVFEVSESEEQSANRPPVTPNATPAKTRIAARTLLAGRSASSDIGTFALSFSETDFVVSLLRVRLHLVLEIGILRVVIHGILVTPHGGQ